MQWAVRSAHFNLLFSYLRIYHSSRTFGFASADGSLAAVSTSGPPRAAEIETRLLHPGPWFLLASFCQPLLQRERELAEAATWLGIDELDLGAEALPSSEDATGRWLQVLERCAAQLGSNVEVRELLALTRALGRQADTADEKEKHVAINELWEDMAAELVQVLGNDARKHASSASTLRGRRWGNLRRKLANALARMIEQAIRSNLLPRDTRDLQTFDHEHYSAIFNALTDPSAGGLAVVSAPPGSGKSELVLAYARVAAKRYDHIFWLRATNRLQLEHDFLEMARILVREPGGRAALRRKAFEKLENSKRWLMIFNSVTDPGVLLPYLPWNPDGHKLCTYWADTRVPEAKATSDDAWSRYHNIVPVDYALLAPLTPPEAEAFLAKQLPNAEREELAELTELVHPSRLATVLAAKWLGYDKHTASVRDYIAAWRRLGDPARATQDERRGYRAAMLTFRGLSDPSRWTAEPNETAPREAAAAELLQRVEPYGAGTFPDEFLDDPAWAGGTGPLDDRRLVVLDALGLADRADGMPHARYFTVNPIVLSVVRDELEREPGLRADNLTIAARSLLHLLQKHTAGTSRPTLFELLPHAEYLAGQVAPKREEQATADPGDAPTYPLLAIEFLAHAAAIHLSLSRLRGAAGPLHRIREIAVEYRDELRAELAATTQIWHAHHPMRELSKAPDEYSFERPIRRVTELMLRMRLDGSPSVAEAVFTALDSVLDRVLPDNLATAADADSKHLSYREEKAHLYFQGALACRYMDNVEDATAAVARARELWERLDDEQGCNSARCVEGLLQRDVGALTDARDHAEAALRKQRDLARAGTSSPEGDRRALIELARMLSLLGAISREQGRWHDAAEQTGEAATTWSRVRELALGAPVESGSLLSGPRALTEPSGRSGLEINELSACSTHVLVRALLGDVAKAEHDALKLWRRAQAIYPRGHRKASVILADTGEVMRLVGEVRQAREFHVQALEMSEQRFAPDHRITTRIRRACAASLLDAGDPATAFSHLECILDSPIRGTIGHILARARAWTTLGRLLIEISLSDDAAKELPQLDLADRALGYAQRLLDRMTGQEHHHPDVATCLLGRAEVAIRRGSPAAVGFAQEAHDLVKDRFSVTGVPLLTPRARLVRAQAATHPEVDVAELKREAAALAEEIAAPDAICTPADRLEIALAAIAAEWADRPTIGIEAIDVDDARREEKLYDDARVRLEAAIKPLAKQLEGESHQLVARSYAELTRLAHRVGSPRQRARNDRERDRAQPAFSVGHEQLRALDEKVRDELELIAFEAAIAA